MNFFEITLAFPNSHFLKEAYSTAFFEGCKLFDIVSSFDEQLQELKGSDSNRAGTSGTGSSRFCFAEIFRFEDFCKKQFAVLLFCTQFLVG